MENGPIVASQVINSSIPSNTEDDELDNFVLQLDEADINNDDNFDDDLKENDRLLGKDDNTDSSANDCTKEPPVKEKENEDQADNELNNVNKLDLAHEDSRFSNHDRLEEDKVVSNTNSKLVNSNDDNSKANCDTEKSCLKSDSDSEIPEKTLSSVNESQNEDQETNSKITEKEKKIEDVPSKNDSGGRGCTNDASSESISSIDLYASSIIKEETDLDEDCLLGTGNDDEASILKSPKREIEDTLNMEEDSLSVDVEDASGFTENGTKTAQSTSKQVDDVIESIDRELDSLLSADGSNIDDTEKNSVKKTDKSIVEIGKNVSPTFNGICNEESNSSMVSDCSTLVWTDSNPSSVPLEKEKSNKVPRSTNVSEQNSDCEQESNLSTDRMSVDDEQSNTMDFEDSKGKAETKIDSESKNAEQLSQDKKSNSDNPHHDVEKNSGLTTSKGFKRLTDREDEEEIKSKKSKWVDTQEEEEVQTKGLNGLKRKLPDIGNKKTEVDKQVAGKKTPDPDKIKVNGHLFNEVKSYVKNDKDFLTHRKRIEKDYLNENFNFVVNRDALDELIMLKVMEFISFKSESGEYRQQGRFLANEQVRLSKQVNSLKKQIEDAKHIIKKLIEEKVAEQPWTQQAIPLKVTRSVGLQVCTCGTVNMTNSKSKDRESVRQLLARSAEAKKNTGTENSRSGAQNVNNSDDLLIVSDSQKSTERTREPPKVFNRRDSANKSMEEDRNNRRLPDVEITPKITIEPAKNLSSQKGRNTFTSPRAASTVSDPNSRKEMSSGVSESNSRKDGSSKASDKSQKVSALIDLTDNEDGPAAKSDGPNQNKKQATPGLTVKPPSALYPPEKLLNTTPTDPLKNSQTPLSSKTRLASAGNNTARKSAKSSSSPVTTVSSAVHPDKDLPKFPATPKYPSTLNRPPRPNLRIGKNNSGKQGIMLSWSFEGGRNPANIEEYQLYAYQENKVTDKNKVEAWKKVGDIKALPLPMACFLTQFVEGHKYHFIVRAVDKDKVLGDFSLPGSIILQSASAANSSSSPASSTPTSTK